MDNPEYAVILLPSTSHAIRAEQVLQRAGVVCRLIPVPRHISSDCGVCVRIAQGDQARAREVLDSAGVREMVMIREGDT